MTVMRNRVAWLGAISLTGRRPPVSRSHPAGSGFLTGIQRVSSAAADTGQQRALRELSESKQMPVLRINSGTEISVAEPHFHGRHPEADGARFQRFYRTASRAGSLRSDAAAGVESGT